MATITDRPRTSAAGAMPEHTLQDGPRGAFFLAGVSTGLLFIGWLAFYFLLFIPRGSVG